MDRQTYDQAETIEQFTVHIGKNRAQFEGMADDFSAPPDAIRALSQLPQDLHVAVIAEEWSGDLMYFVPVLISLARRVGWSIRFFHRDDHPDMILPYRKYGLYHSVPVFIFYDQDFNEVAHWIERPAVATRIIDEESLKLRRRLREAHRTEWQEETAREIADLLIS